MNQTIFVQLQKVLAKLYTNGSSIRRIVDNAGLDAGRIDFSLGAINVWHSVLAEADKVHRVEDLLAIVEEEYRENQGFQAAYRAYRQANGKSGRVESVPEVPVKPGRSWLSAVIVLLLIGVTGSGLYWGIPDLRKLGSGVPTVTPTPAGVATSEGQLSVVPAATTTLSTNSAPTTPTQALAVSTTSMSTTSIPELPTITLTANFTVTPLPFCEYELLILDAATGLPIAQANITVIAGMSTDTGRSNSEGFYLSKVPCTDGNLRVRVRVNAAGYEGFSGMITLMGKIEEIGLPQLSVTPMNPANTPSPSATVILLATPTTTAPIETITPTLAASYPCEAETSFLSNIALIGLRSAPTGRVDRFVPGGVTVLVMGKHQGENLYDIWYSEQNIRGWISPENLILPDSCPK
jgi:hypothetical protein